MTRTTRLLPLIALLGACSNAPAPLVSGCVASEPLVPVCGFQRPEDIELLPDGHTLVISQMGAMDGSVPGSLVLYDTATGTIGRLPATPPVAAPPWGSADCTNPPGEEFSPHGIDLLRRADGALELMVVNHGGRESVELFELTATDGAWSIAWRGCVKPPEGSYLNDVAALPDGRFVASHMFPRHGPTIAGISLHMLTGMLGMDTGYALRCDRERCERLPGTDAPFPNGVQVDAAGSTLYLNAYLAGEVRKIDLASGQVLGVARIPAPDNSQWDARGRLLVASHTASVRAMQACFGITEGACGAAFEILAVDPLDLHAERLLAQEGPPMGAATVAQQVGEAMYLGSFSGDRILRAPMPGAAAR
jgi:hypothetical protein